jgi:hypothetical protein
MAVRKKRDMPFHRTDFCDHTIRTGANLLWTFASVRRTNPAR